MYVFTVDQISRIIKQAKETFPRECCGLLLWKASRARGVLSVVPTVDTENTSVSFLIKSSTLREVREFARASGAEVRGCFHSHVIGAARPSKHDSRASKEAGGLWLIYALRSGRLNLFAWSGGRFVRKRFRIVG